MAQATVHVNLMATGGNLAAALQQVQATQAKVSSAMGVVGGAAHLTALKEQIKLQKQLADLQRAERFAGLVAQSGKFGANLRLLGEEFSVVGQMAESAFGSLRAHIGNAVQAASPHAWQTMQTSFQLLSAEVGMVFIPIITTVAGWLQQAAAWFRSLDDDTKGWIRTLAIVALAGTGTVMVVVRIVAAVTALGQGFVAVGSLALRAGAAMMMMHPVVPLIATVVGLLAALAYSWHRAGVAAEEAQRRMQPIGSVRPGDVSGPGREALGEAGERARAHFETMTTPQQREQQTGLGTLGQILDHMARMAAGGGPATFARVATPNPLASSNAQDLIRTHEIHPSAAVQTAGAQLARNFAEMNTAWERMNLSAPVRNLDELRARLAAVNQYYEQHALTLANVRTALTNMLAPGVALSPAQRAALNVMVADTDAALAEVAARREAAARATGVLPPAGGLLGSGTAGTPAAAVGTGLGALSSGFTGSRQIEVGSLHAQIQSEAVRDQLEAHRFEQHMRGLAAAVEAATGAREQLVALNARLAAMSTAPLDMGPRREP